MGVVTVAGLAERVEKVSTLDELLSAFQRAGPDGVRWRTESRVAGLQYAYAAWRNRIEGRYVVAEAIADASGRILKRNVFTGSYDGDDFHHYFSWELSPRLKLLREYHWAIRFAELYANPGVIGAVKARDITGDPEERRRKIGALTDRWWGARNDEELVGVYEEAKRAGLLTSWSTLYSKGGGYRYHLCVVFDPVTGAYFVGEAIVEGRGAANPIRERNVESGVLKEVEEYRRGDCLVSFKVSAEHSCIPTGDLIEVAAVCRDATPEELEKGGLPERKSTVRFKLPLASRFRGLSSTEPARSVEAATREREREEVVEDKGSEKRVAVESGGKGEGTVEEEDVEASTAVSWLLGTRVRVGKGERAKIEEYLRKWGVKVP